jgi:hypothetical protein
MQRFNGRNPPWQPHCDKAPYRLNGEAMNTRQQGQALIAVIAAMSIVLLLLAAGLTYVQMSGSIAGRQLLYQGQALNAASAGLTDTLSWFRRQKVIVKGDKFLPTNAAKDTEDETVGIVRTFEMSDTYRLMGRYAAPKTGVVDITAQKGKGSANDGTVWQLESTGYVALNKGTGIFDDTKIISRETVRAEIQRLNLNLPGGGAAIYARRGDGVNISAGSKVQGGTVYGLEYPNNTGAPTGCIVGCVTGSPSGSIIDLSADPSSSPVKPSKLSLVDVFGVTAQEIQSMADINAASIADLPKTLPQMSLIVVRSSVVFDTTTPLNGSGILVVFGDLTIPANTNASWSGVIWVQGNFSMAQPSLISGAVIGAGNNNSAAAGTGGKVTLISSGDIAEIDFDPAIMTQIQAQMGNYRLSRSMYVVGKEAK